MGMGMLLVASMKVKFILNNIELENCRKLKIPKLFILQTKPTTFHPYLIVCHIRVFSACTPASLGKSDNDITSAGCWGNSFFFSDPKRNHLLHQCLLLVRTNKKFWAENSLAIAHECIMWCLRSANHYSHCFSKPSTNTWMETDNRLEFQLLKLPLK